MRSRQRLATGNGSTIPLNWYTIDVTWSHAHGRLMQLHEYVGKSGIGLSDLIRPYKVIIFLPACKLFFRQELIR